MSWPIWIVLASTGLVIEPGTPDALCPTAAQVQDAVDSRVGRIELGEGEHFTARYTIVRRPLSGDVVRLELLDPAGELRLQRDLPMAGETCATLAQTIALVLDHFFRDLGAVRPTPPATAPLETRATPAPPPAPVAETSASPPPPSEPPAPPPQTRAPWSFRAALLSGGAWAPASFAFGVEGSASQGPVRLGLSGLWLPHRAEEVVGPAVATLHAAQLRASVAVLAELPRVQIFAGGEVLGSIERASSRGSAADSQVTGFSPAVGGHAGVDFRAFSWGGAGLRAALDWVPDAWAPSYVVRAETPSGASRSVEVFSEPIRGFVGGALFFVLRE